jgi:hypothetical protein
VAEIRRLGDDLAEQSFKRQEGFLVKGVRGQRFAARLSEAASFFEGVSDVEVRLIAELLESGLSRRDSGQSYTTTTHHIPPLPAGSFGTSYTTYITYTE